MRRLVFLLLVWNAALTAGIPVHETYLGPTQQLIKRESWHKIEKNLHSIGIPKKLFPFFDKIASLEDWGHIGYHGATQDYRIYQDIIKFTVEEILGFTVRDSFHFLRVPGDSDLNLDTLEEFRDYWGRKIDNRNNIRAKQLLSLNYSVYSNFKRKGSCSIALFIKDKSKTEIYYAKQLYSFYNNLGIDIGALKVLFDIAHSRLDRYGGILLRLSEYSHHSDPNDEAYNFADQQSYPSRQGGYPYDKNLISSQFEQIMSKGYASGKIKVAPQLRLLLNNRHTLNPYSFLNVDRWDLYNSDIIEAYEAEMRDFIKTLSFDSKKVKKYRKTLLEKWTID